MPTREEIVELLCAGSLEVPPEEAASLRHRLFLQAAQVAAMRCETCKNYSEYFEQVTNYNRMTNRCLKGYVRDQGKDFGCFYHEPKPAG